MANPTWCIVTPSYHVDFEACRLLVDSIARHVKADIRHYIIVPKRDRKLFDCLATGRTVIKHQEDFLPRWIFPSLVSKKWFLSLKTWPVRGWIRQQIVKLATAEMLEEDYFLVIDSDTFFVKDFDKSQFFRDDSVSFYCEPFEEVIDSHDNWQRNSAKMFGMTIDPAREIYVAPFIFWRKDVLQQMFARLRALHGCSWQQVMCRQMSLSEYTLYGVFVRRILGSDKSGHFVDPIKYTHDYYETTPMSREALEDFKARVGRNHFGVSISSKSNTPLALIRQVFGY
jgi:hypothetical protein